MRAGLFAPNARHRRLVVPAPAPAPVSDGAEFQAVATRAQMGWAQRLRRVSDIDVSRCSRCGVDVRVLVCAVQGRRNFAGGRMPGATSPTRA